LKVLVTFAVDDEFAPWRKLRNFQRIEEARNIEAYRSSIGDLEVCVLLTGIGGEKAWVDATKLIWNLDVDICISTGLTGGLRPEHKVGEVVAARQVEATSWKRRIDCDAEMIATAIRCGAKEVQLMYSTDHVVGSIAEKNELGKLADVVDMESGDILYEAMAFGARVIAIRAISDSSDEEMPIDFNRVVNKAGDVSIPRVLGEVLKRPTSLPSLMRFGRQSRAVAESLARFLDRYVQCLAEAKNDSAQKVVS
jgi:adenosylhomocysteine nucleosidase